MKLHHGCEFMELKKNPKPTTPKILIHTSPGPVLLQLPLLLEDLGLPWKGFFDTNSFGGSVCSSSVCGCFGVSWGRGCKSHLLAGPWRTLLGLRRHLRS